MHLAESGVLESFCDKTKFSVLETICFSGLNFQFVVCLLQFCNSSVLWSTALKSTINILMLRAHVPYSSFENNRFKSLLYPSFQFLFLKLHALCTSINVYISHLDETLLGGNAAMQPEEYLFCDI